MDIDTSHVEYEPVIGLEIHAQLLTDSKMFCSCSADYAAAEPNTYVCPVCLGMPGVLPVINEKAVEYTIMTGLALNCHVAEQTRFSRKNYHYPDLMKGYQISQHDLPLCREGWVEIEVNGQTKRVGIWDVHLEEDTAKLFHMGGYTLMDVNRSGVPLIEIVSAPDLRSPEEARPYLTKMQQILRYLGVSTANMEEGAMRCEANVSLRPVGSTEYGTRVEIKNLNSFRAVKLALEREIERQTAILQAGGTVEQQTMGWDEAEGTTFVQRLKEYAHGYRYFPEPDLPPLVVSQQWVDEIRASLPELPDARRDRFVADYDLSRYDAGVLVADRTVADYFEASVAAAHPIAPQTVAHWVTGELFGLMNKAGVEITAVKIASTELAGLVALVEEGAINLNTAKRVLAVMFETGRPARAIVEEQGLAQISDTDALGPVVEEVLSANPDQVGRYRAGKKQLLGWFVGQVMQSTGGQADPKLARQLLEERLEEGD